MSHPERGFLCIEAKGGAVKFEDGKWLRLEHGEYVPYKRDPFDQALDHTYALRRLIDEMPGWRDRPILIGHALSFPEVSLNARRYPPEAPRQILIDRNDVEEIARSDRAGLHVPRGYCERRARRARHGDASRAARRRRSRSRFRWPSASSTRKPS